MIVINNADTTFIVVWQFELFQTAFSFLVVKYL
jgi:hypothetical protein